MLGISSRGVYFFRDFRTLFDLPGGKKKSRGNPGFLFTKKSTHEGLEIFLDRCLDSFAVGPSLYLVHHRAHHPSHIAGSDSLYPRGGGFDDPCQFLFGKLPGQISFEKDRFVRLGFRPILRARRGELLRRFFALLDEALHDSDALVVAQIRGTARFRTGALKFGFQHANCGKFHLTPRLHCFHKIVGYPFQKTDAHGILPPAFVFPGIPGRCRSLEFLGFTRLLVMLPLSNLTKRSDFRHLSLEPPEGILKGFVISPNHRRHGLFPPFSATRIYPGGHLKGRPAKR